MVAANSALAGKESTLVRKFIFKSPERLIGADFNISDEQLQEIIKPLFEYKERERKSGALQNGPVSSAVTSRSLSWKLAKRWITSLFASLAVSGVNMPRWVSAKTGELTESAEKMTVDATRTPAARPLLNNSR